MTDKSRVDRQSLGIITDFDISQKKIIIYFSSSAPYFLCSLKIIHNNKEKKNKRVQTLCHKLVFVFVELVGELSEHFRKNTERNILLYFTFWNLAQKLTNSDDIKK